MEITSEQIIDLIKTKAEELRNEANAYREKAISNNSYFHIAMMKEEAAFQLELILARID